jgi:hypothetical protein
MPTDLIVINNHQAPRSTTVDILRALPMTQILEVAGKAAEIYLAAKQMECQTQIHTAQINQENTRIREAGRLCGHLIKPIARSIGRGHRRNGKTGNTDTKCPEAQENSLWARLTSTLTQALEVLGSRPKGGR